MKWKPCILLVGLLAGGCATGPPPELTLRAPAGTAPEAVTLMEEGNRLFAAGQWEPSKQRYEAAIKAQPPLAEAHYNLALALERLGDQASARSHYIEAANLAPGHKVIWNSPPLRRHGEAVEVESKRETLISPGHGPR